MPEETNIQVGIDLGGTKIELIVLSNGGELVRKRLPTPSSYVETLNTLVHLVESEKHRLVENTHIGIGIPGTLKSNGQVKNANSVFLNGQLLQVDLQSALNRDVRVMNDANCFALSEAIDGAGAGSDSVFGVIIGTGVGGGVVINQSLLNGPNGITGEWGHNPVHSMMPRSSSVERDCYCGKRNCVETFLSGRGLAMTFNEIAKSHSSDLRAEDAKGVMAYQERNIPVAEGALSMYFEQLASCLSIVINVIDPEVIVLGGGLSNLPDIEKKVEHHLPKYVFSDEIKTRVRLNQHGDSSGVRGAAWL